MPKVRASSGMIGTMCFLRSELQQALEHGHESRGGRCGAAARAAKRVVEDIERRRLQFDVHRLAGRHRTAECFQPLPQVEHLRAVFSRAVELELLDLLLRDRHFETAREVGHLRVIELLLLVRGVAAFARLAEPVALHGFGQDDRRPSLVLDGALEGVVDLHGIVAAAAQRREFFVAHVLDEFEQFRILAEELAGGRRRRPWP